MKNEVLISAFAFVLLILITITVAGHPDWDRSRVQVDKETEEVERHVASEINEKLKKNDNLTSSQETEERESELKVRERLTVVATAYYGPLRGQSNYATGSYRGDIRLNGTGITKSGKEVRVGHIAADWSVIPQGTVVYVPGYGKGTVEDIGSAIQGKRIDVFMGFGEEALEKANNWGVREVQIKILEK